MRPVTLPWTLALVCAWFALMHAGDEAFALAEAAMLWAFIGAGEEAVAAGLAEHRFARRRT